MNQNLLNIINKVHLDCFRLCKQSVGKYLPVPGNIGIFCQSDEQYKFLEQERAKLTFISDNQKQKYFQLKNKIIMPEINGIPETIYTWLYIRKPALDTPEWGDVDFTLSIDEYRIYKNQVIEEKMSGVNIYDRPGWDMIEIKDPSSKGIAYITTQSMAEKVHIRFD